MAAPERTPVILGVGEIIDYAERAEDTLEPIALMAAALCAADRDGGGGWLARLQSVALASEVRARYHDAVDLLCEQLEITPALRLNAGMGSETQIRLLHEAAVAIALGELEAAAVVGGEATNVRDHVNESDAQLPSPAIKLVQQAARLPPSTLAMSPVVSQLGIREPAQVFSIYDMATQAAWERTPEQGQADTAGLLERYEGVTGKYKRGGIEPVPEQEVIGDVRPGTRLTDWPYPKRMEEDPAVNKATAIIVTSLALARSAGLDGGNLVYIWGGGAAEEPENYLQRDRYDHSTAQEAVLNKAVQLVGGDPRRFGRMELDSCFPVVPKMALRTLGLGASAPPPTVIGGATTLRASLDNYMAHATVAMVRQLREHPGELGLLYGQGGSFTKHHTLVVSAAEPTVDLAIDFSVQAAAEAARDASPALVENYSGSAKLETYDVQFGCDGTPVVGIVLARTSEGYRAIARVPPEDEATLAILLSRTQNAIGEKGSLSVDVFGKPIWRSEASAAKPRPSNRFCKVEREGPVTTVTIDRVAHMNALHPAANGELAEVFDAFAADPDQWVAIITGAGEKAFSAGNDLKWTAQARAEGRPTEIPVSGFGGLTSRFDLDKPVIAAVNGVAMGGGFEIALACDLIIASRTAVFALPEPKVGLAALTGGLLRLPQQIGAKAAMGMILTGRRVSAEEGSVLGFVNAVTEPGELIPTARRWAAEISACSPMSIRASKALVRFGQDAPTLRDAYETQAEHPAVKALFRSADVREGPLAFAQKRPPQWTTR